MKKIASLLFAQLLMVMSVMPLLECRVVVAASRPASMGRLPTFFELLQDETFMRLLYSMKQQGILREVNGELSYASPAPERVVPVFHMPAAAQLFSSKFPLVLDDPPDEEECKKIVREFLAMAKDLDQLFDPIEEAINSQMGSSGTDLDAAKFQSAFPGICDMAKEKMAAAGIALPQVGPWEWVNGWVGVLGIVIFLLPPILEWWDKKTEETWAHDLLESGYAKNPDLAFEMAEAMGDIRLHWFMDNSDVARQKIANWYHNHELTADGRMCLAEDHQKRKDMRPTPGKDNRPGDRPGWMRRPNGNSDDGLTAGQCKRYQYITERVFTTDANGNPVDAGVEITRLVCVEFW
jgi:hypothetical protein